MVRSLRWFGPALLLSALAWSCGDDSSGSGKALCTRYCAWDASCSPSDNPAPSSLHAVSASPAPIDDSGSASSGCVEDCMADYQDSAAIRAMLPACVPCLEENGCDDELCAGECTAVGESSGPEPLDPPAN